jgi:hypothetical protein
MRVDNSQYLAIPHHRRRSVKRPPFSLCNIKKFEWAGEWNILCQSCDSFLDKDKQISWAYCVSCTLGVISSPIFSIFAIVESVIMSWSQTHIILEISSTYCGGIEEHKDFYSAKSMVLLAWQFVPTTYGSFASQTNKSPPYWATCKKLQKRVTFDVFAPTTCHDNKNKNT